MWRINLVIVFVILGLAGCAAPPPPKKAHHASTYKSDLGRRLDIHVNYHGDMDGAIVVVDLSNPRGYNYRYWLVQVSATDGQIISASRRVFTGTDKVKQLVFKVPPPTEGVMETFTMEVFDDKGKLVMTSEPINNSPKEGKP